MQPHARAVQLAFAIPTVALVVGVVLAEEGSQGVAISALSLVLGCASLPLYLRAFRTVRWSKVAGIALLTLTAIHAVRFVQIAGSRAGGTAWTWFLQSAVLCTLAVVLLAALDRRGRQPEDTGASHGPSTQGSANA